MTTQLTLASLKQALQLPFAPETIQFLPKEIHQENGKYVCLALPYANKRIYEDRLNELVFGNWSTPYTPPYSQGNKLIIPVTVVVLGVPHTDYGEAFFEVVGKNGNVREDENTATEAYSQAFRRACAQFLLGRYLYNLKKLKLLYDPKSKRIAISEAERIAWVEKLYIECGLKPRSYSTPQRPVPPTAPQEQQTAYSGDSALFEAQSIRASTQEGPAPTATTTSTKTAPVQQNTSTPPAPQQKALEQPATTASVPKQPASSASKEANPIMQPTEYQDTFLDWVAQKVERDPERIQGICIRYGVQGLARLTGQQRNDLTKRLREQTRKQRPQPQSGSATSVSA